MSFSDTLKQGQLGESLIAMWLRRQGWHILPAYEKQIDNGKGPRLFMAVDSTYDQLITPDLLCIKGREFRWLEAKHKTRFSWYGKGNYFVTGVDLRHFEHYCHVRDEVGFPVYLMFLHTDNRTWPADVERWGAPDWCDTGLWGGDIDMLRTEYSHKSQDYGPTGMIYWRPNVHLRKYAALASVWPERVAELKIDMTLPLGLVMP